MNRQEHKSSGRLPSTQLIIIITYRRRVVDSPERGSILVKKSDDEPCCHGASLITIYFEKLSITYMLSFDTGRVVTVEASSHHCRLIFFNFISSLFLLF